MSGESKIRYKHLFLAIGITVLLIIVLVVILSSLGSKPPSKPSNLNTLANSGVRSDSEMNDRYKQNIDEYNVDRAKAAERDGTTALPVLTPKSQPPEEKNKKTSAAPTQPVPSNMNDSQRVAYDQNRANAIQRQIVQLFGQWASPESKTEFADLRSRTEQGTGNQAGTVSPTAKVSASRRVVEPGTLLMGTSDVVINTDDGVPVVLAVQSPGYEGAKFIGKVTRRDDMVSIFCDRMIWNGKTYRATAYVLDEETSRGVVSGTVDHKIMARFGWPFLASMVGGYGRLISMPNTVTTIGVAGVTATYQKPTARDALRGAVGTGADAIAQTLRGNANVEPSVEISRGKGLGIYVIDPIDDDGKEPAALNLQANGNDEERLQRSLRQAIQQAGIQQPAATGTTLNVPGISVSIPGVSPTAR